MAKLYFQDIPEVDVLNESVAKSYPSVDTETLRTYMLIRKFSTNLDISLDAYFSQFNLSVGRFTLLILLTFTPDGLMPSDLSQRVGVTQATISGLINSLEKAGLVTRQSHEKDGRAYVIKLTPAGDELVRKISPEYFARIKEFMDIFSVEEKKSLADMIQRALVKITALGRNS